jgi:hypothetical protein
VSITVVVPSGGGATDSSHPSAIAELSLLVSPNFNVSATYGLTYAGQIFDGSMDGKPLGLRTPMQVPASAEGSFTFELPPASVALLSLPSQSTP